MRLFQRSFEIAEQLGDSEVIEATRVQYGIAVAHTLFGGYSECMDEMRKVNTQRLLDFKSSRVDTFSSEAQDEAKRTDDNKEANASSQESPAASDKPSASESVKKESEDTQDAPEGTENTDLGVTSENVEQSQE